MASKKTILPKAPVPVENLDLHHHHTSSIVDLDHLEIDSMTLDHINLDAIKLPKEDKD